MDIVSRSRPRGVLANRSITAYLSTITALTLVFSPSCPFTTRNSIFRLVDRIKLQTLHLASFFKLYPPYTSTLNVPNDGQVSFDSICNIIFQTAIVHTPYYLFFFFNYSFLTFDIFPPSIFLRSIIVAFSFSPQPA